MKATIKTAPDGSLEFYHPYDPVMTADMKHRIPYADRRPVYHQDKFQYWLIAPQHQSVLEDLCLDHLGTSPAIQQSLISRVQKHQVQLFKVEYIGAPKDREDGSVTATGFTNGNWNIVFPQDVLKQWFEPGSEGKPAPNAPMTLYALLGVKRGDDEAAIKSGWRKMARRWHPDINHDPDASDMMKRINDAYQVLGNHQMRRKYDAGLALEASLKDTSRQRSNFLDSLNATTWRPPIRCGWILVEGQSMLGRFNVEKIIQWEDITNMAGQIMVTSWPAGNDIFEVNWV